MRKPDVIVIGAGIVGAACAHALANAGQSVCWCSTPAWAVPPTPAWATWW
jgi:glycerol-3-phosphate dehydrogenase